MSKTRISKSYQWIPGMAENQVKPLPLSKSANLNTLAHVSALAVALAAVFYGSHS